MNLTPDTNVLLRLIVGDDAAQGLTALEALEGATQVAISVHALCEFVWVLCGRYGMGRAEVAAAIRGLIDAPNVVADRPMIGAGLALLESGGDFADGVIAHEGQRLGSGTFVSFDKGAVKLLERQGLDARLLT